MGGRNAPIYVSTDGGNTWMLNSIVPSQAGSLTGTRDITVRFSRSSNILYAGILRRPGRSEQCRSAVRAGDHGWRAGPRLLRRKRLRWTRRTNGNHRAITQRCDSGAPVHVGPDEALAVDCEDLQRRLFPNGLPAPYIEGFVIIQSPESLDVTAVYTTAALDREGRPTVHSSIDVEQIRERRRRAEPAGLPDLIPVPDANGSFCRIRDGQLIVTVRNQGNGPAGPSTTEVDFGSHGKVNVPTPALGPGASTDVSVPIPAGCFSPDCHFRITVDVLSQVAESNEANNTASGFCLG